MQLFSYNTSLGFKILRISLATKCDRIINMLLLIWDLISYFWHIQYESGWFSLRILNCIRQRIMMRFLSVFPTAGAEALLRAASESFEKLRREDRKDCSKVSGGEHEANAGLN